MHRQYESGMTVEKFKLINDHFNNNLSKDKIFLDLTSSVFSTGTYTDIEYRKFIDEFEFVKVAKDTLDVKERTICTYYGRTLKKACNEKRIFNFAEGDKKN